MLSCIFCKSFNIIKRGVVCDKQRYECKDCKRVFREGARNGLKDRDLKVKIIRSYLNGVGLRAISRIFEVPLTTIFYFIKRISLKLEKIRRNNITSEKEIIEVLELKVVKQRS